MITKRIAEIRARCEAATPGPWHTLGRPFAHSENADKAVIAGHWDPSKASRVVAECDLTMEWVEGEPDGSIEDRTNAEFIARARTDLPAVLDALEKAEEALDRILILSRLDRPVQMGDVAKNTLAEIEKILEEK